MLSHSIQSITNKRPKADIVGVFNKHFISAGSVFDNGGVQASNISSVTGNYNIGPHVNHLNFEPVFYAEVYKALKKLQSSFTLLYTRKVT
jgi:hypothetical protein